MGGLRFEVVHVGKVRAPFVRSGIEHYRRRLRPYASLELQALPEASAGDAGPLRARRRREEARFRDRMGVDPHTAWIAVDEAGRRLRSEDFASLLEEWMVHGRSRIALLIGGPWGLPSGIRRQADLVVSLSSMTLSHEVALLVLIEQLYRAIAIINRLPYPK